MAQRPGNLNGNIQRDAAIARIRVQCRIQIARYSKRDAPVAGMQVPAAGDFRAAAHLRLDISVASLQRQRVESPVDAQISVARVGIERAVEIVSFDVAIAGVNSYIALDVAGGYVAVAGIELNFAGNTLRGDIAVA